MPVSKIFIEQAERPLFQVTVEDLENALSNEAMLKLSKMSEEQFESLLTAISDNLYTVIDWAEIAEETIALRQKIQRGDV